MHMIVAERVVKDVVAVVRIHVKIYVLAAQAVVADAQMVVHHVLGVQGVHRLVDQAVIEHVVQVVVVIVILVRVLVVVIVAAVVQIHVKVGVLHVVLASISAYQVVKTLVGVDVLHIAQDVVRLAQDAVVVLAVQVAAEVAVMVAVVVAALVAVLQFVLHVPVVLDAPQNVVAVQLYALQHVA